MNVSRKELAEIFQVTEKMIQNYEKLGLPSIKSGRRGVPVQYELKEVIAWYQQYIRERTLKELTNGGGKVNDENANIELLKNRASKEFYNISIAKENAEIQRIKKEKMMNNLIESGHVKKVLTDVFLSVKSQIETFPSSLSTSLVGKTENDIKYVLNRSVNRLLEQLSDSDAFEKIILLNADLNDEMDTIEQLEDEE